MPLFIISYDLRVGAKPDDYNRIISAITRLGGVKVLFSQFALRSSSPASQIRDHLRGFIDENDRLLVSETTNWASFNAEVDLNNV